MTRTLKALLAAGVLGLGGTAAAIRYAAWSESAAEAAYRPAPPLKGVNERLDDASVLAGQYYCGDGKGYSLDLTLAADGHYAATWRGCLGTYGKADGKWKLVTNHVIFAPDRETDMMVGHLRALEVLKFQGHWIFVPEEKRRRQYYEQCGVNRSSCFQPSSMAFKGQ